MRGGFGLGLGVVGLAVAMLAPGAAQAAELHTVGDTKTADFASISDALSAAADGDVILVVDQGTYSECLDIKKSVTLIGSRAIPAGSTEPGSVTVECSGSDPALNVDGYDVTIVGIDFTHRGGRGASIASSDSRLVDVGFDGVTVAGDGAGIAVDNSDLRLERVRINEAVASGAGGGIWAKDSELIVRGLLILESEAANGGGIYLDGSVLDAAELTLQDNKASVSGGGLYATGSGGVSLRDSVVDSNITDGEGGGVHMAAAISVLSLNRVTFDSNEAVGNGGGLASEGSATLRDSAFLTNLSEKRGAGAWLNGSSSVRGTTFSTNQAQAEGGGLFIANGGTVWGSTFDKNEANFGGGLAIGGGSVVDQDNEYVGNIATDDGGGVWANSTRYTLRGSVFDKNEAAGDGGGLWINANSGSSSSNLLYGGLFENNTADRGGGIAIASNAYMNAYGTELTLNDADVGGGLFIADQPRNLFLDGLWIHGNEARLGGGVASDDTALDTSSTYIATLARSRIYDNIATEHGGGIYSRYTGIQLYDALVYGNEATSDGGGWYTTNNLYSYVRGAVFCDNTAGRSGGGLAWINSWGSRTVYGASFVENTSSGPGGAAFVTGLDRTSGYGTTSSFYYITAVENDSSSTLFDGFHHQNTGVVGQTLNYYGHYAWHAYASVSQASSGSTNSILRFNALGGGRVETLNNPTYKPGDSYSNVAYNPSFSRFTRSDCLDDVLIPSSSTNYGANAVTGAYGRRLYTDGDGDGQTIAAGDCNDSNSSIYSGNTEIAANGRDEDCRGNDDRDGDDDGYASTSVGGTDCNDSDASVHPGATETWYDRTDSDCDGWNDFDQDRDGFDSSDDCDDTDPNIHPDAVESAFDGVDQDCDGLDLDLDGDGYIGVFTTGDGLTDLTTPAEGDGDCGPMDPAIRPGVEEIWYDGVDQNCDGADDYDQDMDGDRSAALDPNGEGTDCDDTDPDRSGVAEEVYYDGIDANCDGLSDFDADLDGDDARAYGGGDCNDDDNTIFTGAPDILDFDESGDPIDNDCDFKPNPDDDGDGVLNYYELLAGTEPNNTDTDGDRIPDGVEWGDLETHEGQLAPNNTDGQGDIDALASDSDGDGLPDTDEAGNAPRTPRDTDGDGDPDFRDLDDDGDGIPTADEIANGVEDSDGDGLLNHLDPDSDNDGVADGAEWPGDRDGDGIPDYLDAGSDHGMDTEPVQAESFGFGLGCSTTAGAPLGVPLAFLPLLLLLRRRRATPND